jgi:nucleotide-binding universal stress UspA family protein
MKTSILVPVDFSDTSSNALSYAIHLFESATLEVTLLSVYGVMSTTRIMKNIDGVLEESSRGMMDELLENFKQAYPGVTFNSQIIKDDPVPAIVRQGNSGDFDFIVMGTKGASGLKKVFLGSVAGGVISKSAAPVIVVPGGHRFRPLDEILFAVGNHPFSDAGIIEPLRRIAKLHQSKIKILHIADEETLEIEEALSALEDLDPSVDYAFGTGKTYKDLREYLMTDYSGLVCLIRGKKGFMDRMLHKSVTLKQTFDSNVPLLILHGY